MRTFQASNADYEARLHATFGAALVEDDLARKHRKMRKDAFQFLRGTCFRWAEAAAELCGELAGAPAAASVGDAHAGNFGLWRDAQARLVWGVNDYDEAARLPYPLDLVRLGASILLADDHADARALADLATAAYHDALGDPQPHVLERRHLWLRETFAAKDDERESFWKELDDAPAAPIEPAAFNAPLIAALPGVDHPHLAARTAGVGSLGRPRYVASGTLRGGPVAVEIKGAMPSCWDPARNPGIAAQAAGGARRSPDPSLIYTGDHVLRRLAPNNRKLDFKEVTGKLQGRLIGAMAADLAAVHAGEGGADRIAADLRSRDGGWLARATIRVADWTKREFEAYRGDGGA